jgi:DMSO reductase anchor subunit
MTQKKLQKKSRFAEYDEDGDGIVSDEELSHVKEIKQTENELRKNLAQLRMARYTLISMGVFTLAMFFIPLDRVKALSDISNLFYISGAGIVGAFMGATAWMNRK